MQNPDIHRWFDIGANLTHGSFASDLPKVLERAQACQVLRIVVTGSDIENSQQAIALAQQWPKLLLATAGVHPHHASQWHSEDADRLREISAQSGVVALGEMGLDYNRNYSPGADQRRCFAEQLALAAELKLPVFLHQRDAHGDFLSLLKEQVASLTKVVVHCFTGERSEMEDYLELGACIGITGWLCDERRGMELQSLVRDIPADRLMIETDAPYLLPRDLPKTAGRRNEPMHLPHIGQMLARLRGEEIQVLAEQLWRNSWAFFGEEFQPPSG